MNQRTSTRNKQVVRVLALYPAHSLNRSETTSYNIKFQDNNSVFECAIFAVTTSASNRGAKRCPRTHSSENQPLKTIPSKTEASIPFPLCRQSFSSVSQKFQVEGNTTTTMDMLVEQ